MSGPHARPNGAPIESPADHYATLGVAPQASQADIKRAYRKLARKYHPDLNKEPLAEARFKELARAHKVLINPQLRAEHDEQVLQAQEAARRPPPRAAPQGFDFQSRHQGDHASGEEDFFSSLFEQALRGGRAHAAMQQPGADEHARIQVDLEDIYLGAKRMIAMSVTPPHGLPPLPSRQLEVHIPAGILPGQRLRLAGQGGKGQAGGADGDLFLEIALRPHRQFRLQGRDVYVDLPVAPWEAALGASVEAPTPVGAVHLNVPPGSTQGRKLRLKGRGVPSQVPGDLYVVLQLVLPEADSATARDAYSDMSAAFAHFNPRAVQMAAPGAA